MKSLIDTIEAFDFAGFEKLWPKLKRKLSGTDKQKLLTTILDEYYSHSRFSQFKRVFDLIIDSKVNLNFNIDHWAPTFLSLVVLKSPSFELFEYFVRKGASINFIGDTMAFETEEAIEDEEEYLLYGRYLTCLDFAEIKLNDLLTTDYNFGPPKYGLIDDLRRIDDDVEITIPKWEYLYLLEQSQYLFDLVKTDKLTDHLKSIGGKTYEALKQELKNKRQRKS